MSIGELMKELAKKADSCKLEEDADVVFFDGERSTRILRVEVFETVPTQTLAPLECAPLGGEWIVDEDDEWSWRVFKPLTMERRSGSRLTVVLRNP